MNRNVFRLQLWASFENDHRFVPLFLDMNFVSGFFIPERDNDDGKQTVNLLYGAEIITVLQEEHLVKHLTDTFVAESKTAKRGV